jgi:hypothetical protein
MVVVTRRVGTRVAFHSPVRNVFMNDPKPPPTGLSVATFNAAGH